MIYVDAIPIGPLDSQYLHQTTSSSLTQLSDTDPTVLLERIHNSTQMLEDLTVASLRLRATHSTIRALLAATKEAHNALQQT